MNTYIETRIAEFDIIDTTRKKQLNNLANTILELYDSKGKASLTFICVQNSRRSHMAQLWAAVAASHYQLNYINTYSGGTQASAINPRTIAAMQRAGFKIINKINGNNPIYTLEYNAIQIENIFSKVYSDSANPQEDFIAVLVCSDAEEACPFVPNAFKQIPVTFEDPKEFDGTEKEESAYDQRSAQIAREIFYTFSLI